MFWFSQGLCLLPVFLVSWSSANFIISYVIAVFKRDTDAIFPYISDTGATPPESCVFGLMTLISAFAGIATIYARFKFVEMQIEGNSFEKPCLNKENKASLCLGMLSCLGMCVVATFQETAVEKVHDIGALLFFVCGGVYMILQSVMSYQTYPYASSKSVCLVRVGLTVIAVAAFFPTLVCAYLAKHTTTLHWDTDDKGYRFHLTSAICEWILAFSFVFFFYTYINDFKLFTLKVRIDCEE